MFMAKMADKIRAMFIFEILGRPPEHIKETMSQLVDKLAELPGIEINKKIVHEPKPVKEEKANKEGNVNKEENASDLFTTFAEVEILGKDINSLIMVVFYAMPSHVEIIEPEEIILRNYDISVLLSDLTVKLHRYDEIAKAITMEKNILIRRLQEMQERINNLEGSVKKPEEKSIIKKEKKSSKKIKKK